MTAFSNGFAHRPLTSFQLAAIAVCIGLNNARRLRHSRDVLLRLRGVKARVEPAEFSARGVVERRSRRHGSGLAVFWQPCADHWGRRRIILLSGVIAGLGMLLSNGRTRLRGSAGAAGPDRHRDRRHDRQPLRSSCPSMPRTDGAARPLAAYATGYPVGRDHRRRADRSGHFRATGWRSAFAIGGAMSLALLLVAWASVAGVARFS